MILVEGRTNDCREAAMKARSGFTLLEILVVVLIITVLAGIVGVNVLPQLGQANVAAATAQIRVFETALKLYRMDNGMIPTQQQGLRALCRLPDIPPVPPRYREEGYIERREVPLDPWGNEYVYLVRSSEANAYEIVSYGADGKPGGDGNSADISSMDL